VRREAELSLEQINDIAGLPGFVQFSADEEKDIRTRAVDALINLHLPHEKGPSAVLTKLQNILNHKLDDDTDNVIEPDVPVDPTVVKALRDRLSDREMSIRRQAARGLGTLRADGGIPELVSAVREDRDDDVRFESARALRKIGNPSVGDRIVPVLNFNNPHVRDEVISTLGALRFRRAVPDLTRVFEQSKPSEHTRSEALSALADIAEPSSAALFLRLKADKDETIRLYANEGLARLANPNTKTDMSAARLTEKSSRVQTAQAFGLLKMGQAEYLEELVRALNSSTTKEYAKEYLQEVPLPQRPTLFAARSKDASVRAQLAEIYGLMGDRAALPALQDLSHDPDAGVAKAAERAIRWINAAGRGE
jgi:HEAT repeat protein